MATTMKTSSRIAKSFVEKGDSRDWNGGEHHLVGLDPQIVNKTIIAAVKEGPGYYWAVIAVLLRLRFGDFLYRQRATSSLLSLWRNSTDDLELAIIAIRDFLLMPLAGKIRDLRSIFTAARSLDTDVFNAVKASGFVDQVAVSMLVFLRGHQTELENKLGKEPDMDVVRKLLVPLLWEVFGREYGAFVTGHEYVSKVIGGSIASDVPIGDQSCLKTDSSGLVLGQIESGVMNFAARIGSDVSKQTLAMTSQPNFPDLFLGKKVQEVVRAVASPAVAARKTNSPEEIVAQVMAAVTTLQENLRVATAKLAKATSQLEEISKQEAAEILRHQEAMAAIRGSQGDFRSDIASYSAQISELRASLEQLGINPLN